MGVKERVEVVEGVEGFLIECTGPSCADRDPKRGRGRQKDHGQTLGRVELDEEDGLAVWHAFADPNRPGNDVLWWSTKVAVRAGESVDDDGNDIIVDFKVTCNQCRRVWIFTVAELTEHHDELARRVPPVALAGEDVGRPVGG